MMVSRTEFSQQKISVRLQPMEFMIRPLLSLAILVCFLLSSATADEREKREIVKRARQATVYIKTNIGQGSGFFVTRDVIVTNFHVIENVRNRPRLIKFWREGQQNWSPVKSVRGYDAHRDLAILKVSPSRVSPLVLGDSDSVEPLDTVYVTGYPKQSPKVTISTGNVSAIHDNYGYERLQFTAPISGGSSGGPVLNDQGEVIGVVTSTRKSEIQFNSEGIEVDVPQNLNMAIPSKHLKTFLRTHNVRWLPPKPKRKTLNRETKRKNEEKAKAEVERAKADTEKAKAEKAKAEARKVEAEARKVEAEAKKAEAEARRVEAVRAKAEAERPKKEKAKVSEPKARITDQLQAATVLIFGRDRNGNDGLLGSGFFVRDGQIATDFHVIDGSTLNAVRYLSKRTTSVDVHLGKHRPKTDKKHHLAILSVNKGEVEPLSLGNSDDVGIGDDIYLVGDPSRGEFTEGKISKILNEGGIRYFEFDAPVSPGSSGGPIVNRSGEVIAVTALKVIATTGTLKNAIPSNYLTKLIEGEGDPPSTSFDQTTIPPKHGDSDEVVTSLPNLPDRLLERGIELYEKSRFPDAIEHLESALNGLHDPERRARAHLYLGFSKWGLAETESSVNADFREALRYNPDVELPPRIGQNHPVFKPLLELARRESIGTLKINASPPESEIWIFGGEMKRERLGTGTVSRRLFKGNYAVEGILEGARKVIPVIIKPGEHAELALDIKPTLPGSQEFELTLDLVSAEKPKEVKVYYTSYDARGNQLERGMKEMQFKKEKPESSVWVYHAKLPSAAQGGKIVYRIEADGNVIRDDPIQVEILEPPESAFIDVNQTIPIKARVISNVAVRDVRVFHDAPRALSESSPWQVMARESNSNTYIGEIPVQRNYTDGATWFYVRATIGEEDKTTRSATRAVRAKSLPPIPVLEPPDAAVLPINKPIEVKAEVRSSAPVKKVRLYYDFPRKQLSETSLFMILENKSSDTYIGKIPRERTREQGYIWYFVMASTENGLKLKSEDRVVEVKEPTTRMHQGVWASHSWSSYVQNNPPLNSDWARGDVVSLAYLSEGKGFQTLGARWDFPYENSVHTSAAIQWGPPLKDSHIAFAILAGVAGYRNSDASFSRARQSTEITPLLGGSLKFYPLDRATIDLTGSIKLRSENGAGSRETDFTRTHLHHYEMGIRLYISPTLNLRAGYGRWRLGEYDNTSVQIGLGATF